MRLTPDRSDENCTPCECATSDLDLTPDRSKDLNPGEFSTAKRASKSLIRSKVRDLVRAPVHPDGSLSPRPIRLGPVLSVMSQGLGRVHISSAPTIDKFSTVPCSGRGVDSPGPRPTARVPVRKVLDIDSRLSRCARSFQIKSTCQSKQAQARPLCHLRRQAETGSGRNFEPSPSASERATGRIPSVSIWPG